MLKRFREWRQRRALDKHMAAKGYERVPGAVRGRQYRPIPGGIADVPVEVGTAAGPVANVSAGPKLELKIEVRDKHGNLKEVRGVSEDEMDPEQVAAVKAQMMKEQGRG